MRVALSRSWRIWCAKTTRAQSDCESNTVPTADKELGPYINDGFSDPNGTFEPFELVINQSATLARRVRSRAVKKAISPKR
ncbi:hypothetical protein RB195_018224 [Necator americanus]|uniref:Uncharacterized protein n=1 Tax=Necator americanus TaxID=51031 RepID=A0ABR1C8R1_NECAM